MSFAPNLEEKMEFSQIPVEGEQVFDKDGIIVYKRPNGDHVAYVSMADKFVESKPAADLDGALAFAHRILQQEEMGHAS
jgi:hypothetical protein